MKPLLHHKTKQPRQDISLDAVKSSQVKSIGYDAKTNTLAVQFNGGGSVYHYKNVTAKQHAELMSSKSIGTHFGKHIKSLPFDKYV